MYDGFSFFLAMLTAFFLGAVISGIAISGIATQDRPPVGFTCTQSQIIDGKAECVEYRRKEK